MIAGEGANQISKDMAERKRNEKGQFVKGNKEGHHFPREKRSAKPQGWEA